MRSILVLASLVVITTFFPNFLLIAQDDPVSTQLKVVQEFTIAKVWSGHPVGFDLLTTDPFQYIAFYDQDRNMCIARRKLGERDMITTILPSKVGWDSHNGISIAVDRAGYLHVSGNMHVDTLVYFRSALPNSIQSFERIPMLGYDESRVTYPQFFKNTEGELFFQYRDGSSGNGITYINQYDVDGKKWSRVLSQGLFDGEGETNAYPNNPVLGADGYFHYLWVWRLNPIANTNHNLSYVRTKDFRHFENIRGESIPIPIRYRERKVIADPVGPWNGLMNSSKKLGFDGQGRVLLGYHKFDHRGISQLFICRYQNDRWIQQQISDWPDFTWEINARGSLGKAIDLEEIKAGEQGHIYVSYTHEKYGSGLLKIDESSLALTEDLTGARFITVENLIDEPSQGMQINQRFDETNRFLLRWETLPSNFDQPIKPPYPEPSFLKLYELDLN